MIFYNYQKPDYDFEREVFGITEEVYSIIDVKNHKGMLVNYFKVSEIMDIWPMPYLEMNKGGYNIGKTPEYDSLEDFIDNHDIPILANCKPHGKYVMNDIDKIGGTSKIIKYCIQKHSIGEVVNSRFIDKSQIFTVKLSLINELLKENRPKFILITRDPYASCLRAANGKAVDMKNHENKYDYKFRLNVCSYV